MRRAFPEQQVRRPPCSLPAPSFSPGEFKQRETGGQDAKEHMGAIDEQLNGVHLSLDLALRQARVHPPDGVGDLATIDNKKQEDEETEDHMGTIPSRRPVNRLWYGSARSCVLRRPRICHLLRIVHFPLLFFFQACSLPDLRQWFTLPARSQAVVRITCRICIIKKTFRPNKIIAFAGCSAANSGIFSLVEGRIN